jgi:hypothetical protein
VFKKLPIAALAMAGSQAALAGVLVFSMENRSHLPWRLIDQGEPGAGSW